MSSIQARKGKGTPEPKVSAEAFARYGKRRTLIPLRHFKAKDAEGKSTGKLPRKGWTTKKYVTASVIHNAVADNTNVGWRLGPEDLVLDIDPRNDGLNSFARLCSDVSLDQSRYVRVDSGRGDGGFHLYMLKPADMATRETLEEYPGIEFKAIGRQVVCAGSLHHATGKHYTFVAEGHPQIEGEARSAPKALLKLIQYKPSAGGEDGDGVMTAEGAALLLDDLDPAVVVPDNDAFEDFAPSAKKACADADAEAYVLDWLARDKSQDSPVDRWNSYRNDKPGGKGVGTFIYILKLHGVGQDAIDKVFPPTRITAKEDFPDDTSDDMDFDTPADDDDSPSADEWLNGGDITDVEPSKAVTVVDPEAGLSPLHRKGLVVTINKKTGTPVANDTIGNALTAVANSGLVPAWNVLKQHVEFRGNPQWNAQYGYVLTDHLMRLIRLYLITKHQGVAFEPRVEHLREALLTVAYGNIFNPIGDYLDSLKWDRKPRVEKLFGEYFQCRDDDYTRGVSKAFMIGAVRRVRSPGCKFDTMPVLKGPQGWNKSSALRILFGPEYFSDADLGKNLSDKDVGMKIRGVWCQEFAEIDSLTHHMIGHLKAFLSRAIDRQRDPYGVFMQDVPRNVVFTATVNEGGYLKDQTGGRRFWPLDVRKRIELDMIAADRDQLWAEAAKMESDGESLELPEELWPEAAKRQRGETTIDPWADLLGVFLRERADDAAKRAKAIADGLDVDGDDFNPEAYPDRPARRVMTSELYTAVGVTDAAQTKGLSQRIRTVMESLGWTYREGVRVGDKTSTGYILKKPGAA